MIDEERPAKIATRTLDLDALKRRIEANLADHMQLSAQVPGTLLEALRHSLLGPSKRVRSTMLCLFAARDGHVPESALDAGAAVEMVHSSSLIFDDLPCMDDAELRRQRPTTHRAYGEATAILSGIALLNGAFGVLARLRGVSAETRLKLIDILEAAVGWKGLVAGQEIDVRGVPEGGWEAAEEVNWLKTGVLFVASAEMGGVIRGADAAELAAIRLFARELGLAFQVADDLADHLYTPADIGKDVGKDASKATIVNLIGLKATRERLDGHIGRARLALEQCDVDAEPFETVLARFFLPLLKDRE